MDSRGAVDLREYLEAAKFAHDHWEHRMGLALTYPDNVSACYPRKGQVGEGNNPASEDHYHPISAVWIRNDSVAGGDDDQFATQLPSGNQILRGTCIGTVDPGADSTKRYLSIRFGDDWYGVTLTRDTNVASNNTFTSVDPDQL